jgi:hypothetical protein
VAGPAFLIDGYRETKGDAKDPQHVVIDLFVEEQSLAAEGVRFIRTAGKEY